MIVAEIEDFSARNCQKRPLPEASSGKRKNVSCCYLEIFGVIIWDIFRQKLQRLAFLKKFSINSIFMTGNALLSLASFQWTKISQPLWKKTFDSWKISKLSLIIIGEKVVKVTLDGIYPHQISRENYSMAVLSYTG